MSIVNPNVIAMNGLSSEEAIANFAERRDMAALYSMRLPRYRSQ
jgi:hypothetical protein